MRIAVFSRFFREGHFKQRLPAGNKESSNRQSHNSPQVPGPRFIRAEVLFTCAEAAALCLLAIKASLKQPGISEADVNTYLGRAEIQYDGANFRRSIGELKWIALYGQGLEAFAEWCRLDYPRLTPAVTGVLNGQIPVRLIYPGMEQSLNGFNNK